MKVLILDDNVKFNRAKLERAIHTQRKDKVELTSYQGKDKHILNSYIRENEIDLLVTFDLHGFENVTLMDGISYNLLDCKQVHFLTKERLTQEASLNKQLSISMFFYVFGEDYFQYLSQKYPDIPYLRKIEKKEEDDLEYVLGAAINEVINECG